MHKKHTDLATNMLDKKNEGDHKAANASHPGDEAKKSKEMDPPSCAKIDTYSITRAECPGEEEGRFLRIFLVGKVLLPQKSSH